MSNFANAIQHFFVGIAAAAIGLTSIFTPGHVQSKPTPVLSIQPSKQEEMKLISPTIRPTVFQIVTPSMAQENPVKKWRFSNAQYDLIVSNVNYFIDSSLSLSLRNKVSFDFTVKNISVLPFIIAYQISDCEVMRGNSLTRFTGAESDNFGKGILPGESTVVKINTLIRGSDYDTQGNQISPSADLRFKSCKVQLKTPDDPKGIPLHKVTDTIEAPGWIIEPKAIDF